MSLPADVSMYVYVPTQVVAKPPLLVLIHYCGGNSQAIFGQAEGGGLVAAADQYGFIIVVPSNAPSPTAEGRCWDVSSAKALKRDGGGDTHAIAQMVRYSLTQYQANAERVYATGNSSGGMTTQLMLALYPDIFKAGSAFAGVPAGCSNVFDAAGLCGLPAQTAQQWGDRARALDPGYAGHRPRVQLFHGDKDNLVWYPNFGESIKQWSNVLGLPLAPTSTDTSLTLGTNPTHKATRQSWKNACGHVVLDAFTEHIDAGKQPGDMNAGGDHGPSDTLFVAKYVVPFLGLDKTGDLDPEIEQCSGGSAGAGGGAGAGAGGAGAGAGGVTSGGTAGGSVGGQSGGVTSGGTGGALGSAGSSAQAGSGQGLGGATATAGQSSTNGGTSVGSGGSASTGGSAGGSMTDASSGCGCALGKTSAQNTRGTATLALGFALLGAVLRRRNRR